MRVICRFRHHARPRNHKAASKILPTDCHTHHFRRNDTTTANQLLSLYRKLCAHSVAHPKIKAPASKYIHTFPPTSSPPLHPSPISTAQITINPPATTTTTTTPTTPTSPPDITLTPIPVNASGPHPPLHSFCSTIQN